MYGARVSKQGEDARVYSLNNLAFDSEHPSLMLIDTKEVTFTAPQGEENPWDTETYNHGLGYAPLILASVDYKAGPSEYYDGPIPYNYTVSPSGAFSGNFLFSYINMDITTSQVKINWDVMEFVPGELLPMSADVNYTVTLNIYGYKLGSLVG
jgi:hypothetical protein